MLLKPIIDESIVQKIKLKYFSFQQCLVNSSDQFTSLVTFLVQMLCFVPTVSIFFKDSDFYQPQLSKLFSFFTLSQFHTHFDVDQVLTLVLMSLFCAVFLITALYTYNVQKTNTFSSRLYVNLLRMIIYFSIPFNELHLTVLLKNYNNPQYRIFKAIAGISLVFGTLFAGLFIKLKIKPLRKNNIQWNLSNQYEFNRFFLNFTRSLIFMIDGLNIFSLIISAALQYIIRIKITKYYQKQYLKRISASSNLVIATHCVFLFFKITEDQQLSVKFLLVLWIILLFKGTYEYYNEINKPLEFPLCQSSPYDFYEFYFKLCAKYEQRIPMEYQSNEHFYYSTLKQHSRKCTSKQCPLAGVCLMKKNIVPQIQIFVSEILARSKNYSPYLQVLEEFWKLQRGKKFNFRVKSHEMDFQTEYMIFSVKNSQMGRADFGMDAFSSECSLDVLNNIFLEHFMNILLNFSQFYSELLKAKPKLQIITLIGQKIRVKGEQIQDFYMDLLKKKAINYKSIELYLQFENYFLRINSLNYDLMKKIVSIQKNLRIDDISQIYLPAISVYSQTGIIEDVNMQCIHYLKYNRFEIKTKYITDILFPDFKYETYFQSTEQQVQNSLMFIKKKYNQYVCGNLRINSKFINNKKIYVFIFQKKKKNEGSNFILLNDKFDIVSIVTQTEILKEKRHPSIMATIKWKDIFNTHVKKHQRELTLTKLIKVDLKEYDCILMCSLNKTFNQSYSVLSLKIMKNIKEAGSQRRSVILRSTPKIPNMLGQVKKFEFYYDLSEDNEAIIKGYIKDNNQLKNHVRRGSHCLDMFSVKMRTNLVDFTLIKNRNFNKGIKTYRLYGQDLYNIDLEDKQGYINEFQGRRHHSHNNQRQTKKPVDIYIIALVVGVSLLLAVVSCFLLYSLNTKMVEVSDDFKISNEIVRFKINFYRILAMLRDVASGLYEQVSRDWIPDVLESYNLIHNNANKKMFSNKKVTMTYNEYNYTGNLNELTEVILSDVFTLTKKVDVPVIENIHNTSILEVSVMIEAEQNEVSNKISQNLRSFRAMKNWVGLGMLIGIIVFYLLMIYLCWNLVNTIKHNLYQLMLISEFEAKESHENAQKLLYAIDMIRKNFQIDIKNFIYPRKRYRRRRKQKTTIIGYNIKILGLVLVGLVFVINISVIFLFNSQIESNFEDFELMKFHGQTVLASYSDLCMETNVIDHTGIVNMDKIMNLKAKLFDFEVSVTNMIFSENTIKMIHTYFLEDSCSIIQQNSYLSVQSDITCQNSTPGYDIQNPFGVGLNQYFTRIHYNIIDNITDAYACTGIYSSLFSKVFQELSRQISADGEAKLGNFIFEAGFYSSMLIVFNALYCLFALCLSMYVKRKNESVQKLIRFLNLRTQVENKHHIKPKNKQPINSEKSIEVGKKKPKRLSMLENGLY